MALDGAKACLTIRAVGNGMWLVRLVNKGGAQWRVKLRLSSKSFNIFHSTNSQGWRHTQWKVNQKHYFESTWVMQKIVSLENVTHIFWKWKVSGTIMLLWGLSYCCSSNARRFSIWTPYCIKARQTKVSLSQLRSLGLSKHYESQLDCVP